MALKVAMHNWMRPEPIATAVRRLGRYAYDGIEISGEPSVHDSNEVRSLLAENEVECWGAVTLMVGGRDLVHEDKYVRLGSVEYVRDTIDMVKELGGSILTIVPSRIGKVEPMGTAKEEWRWAVESLKECQAHAESQGVRLALEPINRFEGHFLNRCEQALELADAVGGDCGVCLDVFHMNIEEPDLAGAIRSAGERLVNVHVADNNHLPPGRGAIDWELVVRTLAEVGYDGFLAVEFVAPGLPDGLYDMYTQESIDRCRHARLRLHGQGPSNAYRKMAYMTWPPPLLPRLVLISGRDEAAVAEAARRYGFERYVTDWREQVADDEVELFDNGGPNNLHAEPTIAAAEAGRHVLCEKPLGRDAEESHETWQRVRATGVKHMCAFNYRFVPAVRLARELLEASEVGDLYHLRGSYLHEWGDTDDRLWRFDRSAAGSGALGDLGAHVVDLARYLVGEIASVSGTLRMFKEGRDVDDAFEAVVEFERGAVGTIEASRFCSGRRNGFAWKINGSRGSIAFDLERLNELQVYLGGSRPRGRAQGFRTVLVSEADHPFWEHWWPPGHIIGWEHSFVHEIHHLLTAIAEDGDVAPHGATLEDGYRAAEVCDAIVRANASGRREEVSYR
jgi:predicted dehydrogenase/sugar phosphate isomerase/epimerase